MKTKNPLINDEQTLNGAMFRSGIKIPVFDNGYGPLFIHRNSMGITGIIRTQKFLEAYAICEDEFFPAGDTEANDELIRIAAMPDDGTEQDHARLCWDESYGYRGNGREEKDGTISYIYQKDLNGDCLELLTLELVKELGIVLDITDNE